MTKEKIEDTKVQIEETKEKIEEAEDEKDAKPSAQGRIEKRIIALETELKNLNRKLQELLDMENEPESENSAAPNIDNSVLIM